MTVAAGPLLRADHVMVRFGRLVAVDGVSLEVRPGELVGLVGPNGAGKTTLLRAMAGLQPVDAGRVTALGEPVVPGNLAVNRHLGFAADASPVYEELTVGDFLTFIGKAYGLGRGELRERIGFWLEQVWLSGKADAKIRSLSRGMRQRVGIARTLLPNPAVVLLDEPAAGLDPAGRVQFRRLLCSLRDQGKALIVSSHILADLNEYCTHIAIMSAGRIVQLGTVAQMAAAADGERCRYTVVLARPVAGLEKLLATIDGLTGVQWDRDQIVFEYGSRREQAAALLGRLVAAGLPMAEFRAHRADLEEAYLRTGIRQVD